MGAANVNAVPTLCAPLGAASNAGMKLGFITGVTKAAQNDTITLKGITTLYAVCGLANDAPADETFSYTAAGVITCTSVTASTTIHGVFLYK